MWKLSNSWPNPTSKASQQRGFPAPGSGAQFSGQPSARPEHVPWYPVAPTKGKRTFFQPAAPRGLQQGFAPPESPAQERPPGSMPNIPPVYGGPIPVWTPYFSRGAAAYVQNYGKVLTNPIGAGIVATARPQASYGVSGQYENGAIWWTSQVIPTSINLNGLSTAQELADIVGDINVYAMVPTTG